ncbi:AAA family ATPase [Cellulomonas edaphi]|uniref:LuxR C-terminal-related transcriptional regulator n=1 Tax=Cellulomonas edaphi TaxID=3053468 RepID=A0ABT7S8B9_9CELL|nr:LuxR family transcriptional regulator [Cellulomons edaphi]MDM7831869.1 LuxR C-terminal-related transcriptional regulator [Cellulomons edaphi]
MGLFERAPQLDALGRAMERVLRTDGSASGTVVTIAGAAGAGKTSVVGAALAARPAGLRVLAARCDPLSTPRPLGPIRDVVAGIDGPASAETLLGAEADFAATVSTTPSVLVVDDAQWIDAASVEVLRFLVRRIERIPVVVVVAYRDVPIGHALLALLGDVARMESTERLTLPPLSAEAVRALVGERVGEHGVDHQAIRDLTGGNPFFVAEIARHPGQVLPTTVRDAVLSSTAGLAPAEVDALQLIATAPDVLDNRLLPYLGLDVPLLRRLESTGLLVRSPRGVAFRHELARLAVASSIEPGVDALLHLRVLDAWEQVGAGSDAVLTHHAAAGGDVERTRRYAILAAADATAAGAHTEAVAFLSLALEHLDDATAQRATLLEQLSTEQYMVSRLPAALTSIDEALRIRELLGDRDGVSVAHDRRAVVEYYSAQRREAERHADAAAAASAGPEALASAHATRAYLAYRHLDVDEARAIADAQRDRPTTGAADLRLAITEAGADLVEGRASARTRLVDAANAALSRSFDEVATTAYSNLSAFDVEHRRLDDAEAVLATSIPMTVDLDIALCRQWQTGMRSRLHLLRGRWAASAEDAAAVLDDQGAPLTAVWPHIVAALLAIRTGADTTRVEAHLASAEQIARDLDESLVTLALRSAVAEGVWHGRADDARLDDVARRLADAEQRPGTQWAVGDLRVWLARTGRGDGGPTAGLPEPYRLELDGAHADAARAWRDLGAPYDAAVAEVHARDAATAAAGLARLDALDVPATAARARAMLTARGLRALPSRPRPGTLANPSGLTNRQLDVARLVAQGLTNAELATALYISAKTADHHVSAILAKLGLSSRREIVRNAASLGLGRPGEMRDVAHVDGALGHA